MTNASPRSDADVPSPTPEQHRIAAGQFERANQVVATGDYDYGIHLLLADDATAFADACQLLLRDSDLRKRMVDAAEELYLQSYQWSAVQGQLQQLVKDVAETPMIN